MLTISKNIFILLSLTALHPSNTFGGTVHEDSSTQQLSKAVGKSPNEFEVGNDDDENLLIFSKGDFVGYIPFGIESPLSRLLEPNMEVDTKLDYNSLFDKRRQEPNNSPLNQTSNQDNVIQHLKEQQHNLTQQISNLQIFLNKTLNSKENNEIQSNARNYDEHFNCIRNCSSSGSLPQSCSQATSTNSFQDGVYLLKEPQSDSKPFYVYCAHENENEKKSWMLIQRREDGSVDFNRNWLDYKLGFGDINGEYWIGLERLHQITSNRPHELWIELLEFGKEHRYAKYSEFIVESEDEDYKLTLGGYEGDAGDSFELHSSMKFSTFDKDNDASFKNCAREYKGGWWYKQCYYCNLNGIYKSFANNKEGKGIICGKWHGHENSLRYVRMGIRPKEA